MVRTSRVFFTLLFVFSISFSSVFATNVTFYSSLKADAKSAAPQVGVIKISNDYYYKYPVSKQIRKKSGFITWNDRLYYVQTGGKIVAGKTFNLGNDYYRACLDGSIARGVYR